MNRLEELIVELCPNGVEYITLNDICSVYDGTHQTPEYTDSGVRFVSVENINALYDTNKYISVEAYEKYKIKPQKNDILMTRIGSIGTCAVVDRDEPLAYYVSLALLRPDLSKINSYYLKYVIESKQGRKELRKRTLVNAVPIKVNMGDIGKIIIPVPPIKVQEEIVKILDNFTEKSYSLINELEGEVSSRKKQYDYYTSYIMSSSTDTKQLYLGDIGTVRMCKRIMKSQTNTEKGIPFYKIGTFGKEADAYISEDVFNDYREKYSYPKKGDILISCAGTIGRTVVFDGKPAYFQDSNIVWLDHDETIVTNRYLQYCYKKDPWKISTGGTIARLYNDNILKAKIYVPPIEEQNRIVTLLEKCDRIFNDIIEKLSKEIEDRRKQYDYYRDQLLSFKQLSE